MQSDLFAVYASVAASVMLLRSVANEIIPETIKSAASSALTRFFKHFLGRVLNLFSAEVTLVVDEQGGNGITRNQIYDAAEIYLRTIDDPDTDRFIVNKNHKESSISLSIDKNQKVVDFFQGFKITWQLVIFEPANIHKFYNPERRYFELTFAKSRKDNVINEYLPFVLAKAKELTENNKEVKLYTRDLPVEDDDDYGESGRGDWGCVNLDHPITFDKLAMDPQLKQSIIADLDRFVRRKEYYKKVGKAWKRGYLLYGPPGTGKSSLIAAMANYLKFDVYDLELTSLRSNSDLRKTLLSTTDRSILVIEDIDCSVQIHNRETEEEADNEDLTDTKITLSGLLNFIDGLWSNCGDERIIIFTTNHMEKLDPALLRPGRMDMHIHMGHCTPEGFDVLASNYLGIESLSKAPIAEIKGLIKEVEISPAEIAEHLMRSEDANGAIEGVTELLRKKKEEQRLSLERVGEGNVAMTAGSGNGKKKSRSRRDLARILKSLRKFRKRSNQR